MEDKIEMEEVDLSCFKNHSVSTSRLLTEKIIEDSFESTRRMLILCEESENVGCKTAVMLHQQGEQLKNVESGMDRIQGELNRTNKYLNRIERFCGICALPFTGKKKLQKLRPTWGSGKKSNSVVREQPSVTKSAERNEEKARLTQITDSPVEEEIEDNLAQVTLKIGSLKSLALNMSDEIDSQNCSLDRITCKSSCNQDNINILHQRVEKT